jgi:hypothetical protein
VAAVAAALAATLAGAALSAQRRDAFVGSRDDPAIEYSTRPVTTPIGDLNQQLDAGKDMVYRRMWQILSGEETQPKYARLSPGDRRAIVEILSDTKKDLPRYFQPSAI